MIWCKARPFEAMNMKLVAFFGLDTSPIPLTESDYLKPKLSLCCIFAMKQDW